MKKNIFFIMLLTTTAYTFTAELVKKRTTSKEAHEYNKQLTLVAANSIEKEYKPDPVSYFLVAPYVFLRNPTFYSSKKHETVLSFDFMEKGSDNK